MLKTPGKTAYFGAVGSDKNASEMSTQAAKVFQPYHFVSTTESSHFLIGWSQRAVHGVFGPSDRDMRSARDR
jgi:hypothetical protein